MTSSAIPCEHMSESGKERLQRIRQRQIEAKQALVDVGITEFGFDFFMVDPSTAVVKAAPFHIENEEDVQTFVLEANPHIAWRASSAGIEVKAALKKRREILQ
jgi:hypothetical protein